MFKDAEGASALAQNHGEGHLGAAALFVGDLDVNGCGDPIEFGNFASFRVLSFNRYRQRLDLQPAVCGQYEPRIGANLAQYLIFDRGKPHFECSLNVNSSDPYRRHRPGAPLQPVHNRQRLLCVQRLIQLFNVEAELKLRLALRRVCRLVAEVAPRISERLVHGSATCGREKDQK